MVGVTRLGALSFRAKRRICSSDGQIPGFVITPFTQACAQAGPRLMCGKLCMALRAVQSKAPACRRSGRIFYIGQTDSSCGRSDKAWSFVITPFTQACARWSRGFLLRLRYSLGSGIHQKPPSIHQTYHSTPPRSSQSFCSGRFHPIWWTALVSLHNFQWHSAHT